MAYSEDTLVQQTTVEYLEKQLGWESIYAYNNEDFGPESLLGREGLKEVARLCHLKTEYAKSRFAAIPGVEVAGDLPTFNEFVVKLPVDAGELAGAMVERGIAPGLPLGRFYGEMDKYLLIAVTEKRSKYEIGALAESVEATLCR